MTREIRLLVLIATATLVGRAAHSFDELGFQSGMTEQDARIRAEKRFKHVNWSPESKLYTAWNSEGQADVVSLSFCNGKLSGIMQNLQVDPSILNVARLIDQLSSKYGDPSVDTNWQLLKKEYGEHRRINFRWRTSTDLITLDAYGFESDPNAGLTLSHDLLTVVRAGGCR